MASSKHSAPMKWIAKSDLREGSSSSSSRGNGSTSGGSTSSSRGNNSSSGLSRGIPQSVPPSFIQGSASASSRSSKQTQLVFVPYLPQDEAGLNPSEAQQVADLLNANLNRLLKMKAPEFWEEVSINRSLNTFLDSYLQFSRRWFDIRSPGSTVIVGDETLSRRVFMVFLRMSSNLDEGRECIRPEQHAALLLQERLFTISRLMDICALYSQDNADLTSRLVKSVFDSQPAYRHELSHALPQMLQTIKSVYDRCLQSVQGPGHSSESRLKDEFIEVLAFVNDTVRTLESFLRAYPASAEMFLPPESARSMDANIFSCVASLHDVLLPALRQGMGISDSETHLKIIRGSLMEVAWLLLFEGCIKPAMEPNAKGRILVEAVVALGGGDVTNNNSFLHALAKGFDLTRHVQGLFEAGSISLDDSQYAVMLTLLPDTRQQSSMLNNVSSSVSDVAVDEDSAVRQSLIAQIKDLFPEYGDGFLQECLLAYDNNPEVVIQHILDGTLHPELVKLDVTLEKPIASRGASSSSKDKGKGKVGDPVPTTKKAAEGRYVRRSHGPKDAKEILDVRDTNLSSQTLQLAMLYEDEYDDSFDDLDMSVGTAGMEADSLVDWASRKKKGADEQPSKDGAQAGPPPQQGRKGAQYFMKDGKLYNYKVQGSMAVSSVEEGEALAKHEAELVHGLGRGGNVPFPSGVGAPRWKNKEQNDDEEEDAGGVVSRPAGNRKFRRDRAMKKHMAALGGR